ncbi:uncharacterized protein LOC119404423 isoform X1 [Rhipicephalus sanguineus]|uniref:uncharacterized protein LOC119404423 isoform X1 n=1 Tax=Rhipicephalus sanguineus TaxID=34632 RepID=UPI0020C2306D|nr:uncharacterized protein LOC119404423 isoform X1 [Rhipicephalus sanguineus]
MADYCFILTEHLLGFALTAPALRGTIDVDRKHATEALFETSRSHLQKALEACPWMDNATKVRSFDRIDAMQLDWMVHENLPWEEFYASVPPMTHESFVTNWKLLVKARRAIRSSMLSMNARYHSISEDGRLDQIGHRLTVPVARLQPPLFYGIREPSIAVALLGSWFMGKRRHGLAGTPGAYAARLPGVQHLGAWCEECRATATGSRDAPGRADILHSSMLHYVR